MAIENGPVEIVDFPIKNIKNCGSFHSYVNVYQRVNSTHGPKVSGSPQPDHHLWDAADVSMWDSKLKARGALHMSLFTILTLLTIPVDMHNF